MNYRKIVAAAAGLATVATAAFSGMAYANEGKGTIKKLENVEKKIDRLEDQLENFAKLDGSKRGVVLKDDGTFRITGVIVNSVSTADNTLNVSFFGFSKTVSAAGAKLIGGGQTITLSDFRQGDRLSGRGTYTEATKAITVTEIHNHTYRTRNASDTNARIQSLLQMIRQLEEQIKALKASR